MMYVGAVRIVKATHREGFHLVNNIMDKRIHSQTMWTDNKFRIDRLAG